LQDCWSTAVSAEPREESCSQTHLGNQIHRPSYNLESGTQKQIAKAGAICRVAQQDAALLPAAAPVNRTHSCHTPVCQLTATVSRNEFNTESFAALQQQKKGGAKLRAGSTPRRRWSRFVVWSFRRGGQKGRCPVAGPTKGDPLAEIKCIRVRIFATAGGFVWGIVQSNPVGFDGGGWLQRCG